MTLSSNSPPSSTPNTLGSSPSANSTLCPSPRTRIWWSRSAPQSPWTSPPGTTGSETCSGNTRWRNPLGTPPWSSLSRRQRRSNKKGQFDGQSVRWRRKTVVAERCGGTGSADFRRYKMHLQCSKFGFLKPNWPYCLGWFKTEA